MANLELGKTVDQVQFLIENIFTGSENLTFVDCTAGNGYDSLFLCKLAGENGKVLSFDVQKKAIERTKILLENNLNFINYELINDSHENIDNYLKNNIDCAIFNLGYLPYSDKIIKTKPEITIQAIDKLLPTLKPKGKIFVTSYIKHDDGYENKELYKYLSTLCNKKYNIIHTKIINKNNFPPEIFIIEKNA